MCTSFKARCVVRGLTDNLLLNISITTLLVWLVFFAKYSVIPKVFPFKKDFFETGPLINFDKLFCFIKFKAILKVSSMYLFDLLVIFSKHFLNL